MRAPFLSSLRARLLATFLLPVLGLFWAAGWTASSVARAVVEEELGRSLSLQAAAAASQLSAERLLLLAPGDEPTRTFRNLSRPLEEIRAATGARRIFAFDRQGRVWVDSGGALPIGTEVPELGRDRAELRAVFSGRKVASAVLFEGSDAQLYKTGYAPLRRGTDVVGAVGVEGSAAFFRPLARLSRMLEVSGAVALVLLAGLVLWTARSLTQPLRRLMKSALRIGGGDLVTPVPAERTLEIGVLARELEAMRQALESRERQLTMMLAGVAHEVRNPMGGIELFAGLLAEELAGAPAPEVAAAQGHVARILKELEYLKRIVDDFLAFAREEKLTREPVSAEQWVTSARDMMQAEADRGNVHLRLEVAPAMLELDLHLMLAALVNLLKNALQASPVGGSVVVRGQAKDGAYELDVQDEGKGVPADARLQIFEPFFTTREKGTGLGLPLARKIAQAHGGSLQLVASERGACFRLRLPMQTGSPSAQPSPASV